MFVCVRERIIKNGNRLTEAGGRHWASIVLPFHISLFEYLHNKNLGSKRIYVCIHISKQWKDRLETGQLPVSQQRWGEGDVKMYIVTAFEFQTHDSITFIKSIYLQ